MHTSKRTAIWKAIRRFMVGEEGAALVEFTVLAPLFVIVSVYTMDFGLRFYHKMVLQNAAQAGVQWAITSRIIDLPGVEAVAAQNIPSQTMMTNIAVTPNYFCGCPSSTGVTQVGLNNTLCSNADPIGAACALPNTAQGNYLTVVASGKYNSFIFLSSPAPTLSATTTVRIQ